MPCRIEGSAKRHGSDDSFESSTAIRFFFFFMPDPDVQQDKEWLQNRWLGHLMLA